MTTLAYQEWLAGMQQRVARNQAQRDDIANRIVDRDPCTYCGVRRDIGCRHTRGRV
jgi:hypothetical protein